LSNCTGAAELSRCWSRGRRCDQTNIEMVDAPEAGCPVKLQPLRGAHVPAPQHLEPRRRDPRRRDPVAAFLDGEHAEARRVHVKCLQLAEVQQPELRERGGRVEAERGEPEDVAELHLPQPRAAGREIAAESGLKSTYSERTTCYLYKKL
jgi:hypothetical protein